MSRKQSKSDKRRRCAANKRQHAERGWDEWTKGLALRFSCATETAREFADQSYSELEDLDDCLVISRFARDVWHERAAEHPRASLLHEYVAEHERHTAALRALEGRLVAVTRDPAAHHHFDRDLEIDVVRRALEPSPRPVDRQIPDLLT